MKIGEFMTTKLETINADGTVYDAIERMVNRRLRSLLVIPAKNREEYGVITARDVVFRVLSKGLNPTRVKVSEISSKPLVCIDKETELEDAAALMESSNIARVFVCEDKNIIGLVSLLDVMAASLVLRARGNYVV